MSGIRLMRSNIRNDLARSQTLGGIGTSRAWPHREFSGIPLVRGSGLARSLENGVAVQTLRAQSENGARDNVSGSSQGLGL